MSSEKKQTYKLEGLSCANCSAKIEKSVGSMKEVSECNINFMTKTLNISITDELDKKQLMQKIDSIIKSIEPEVSISEKTIDTKNRTVLIATDLHCVDCSAKIKQAIENISGVKSVAVDYESKRVTLELNEDRKLSSIIKGANKAASRIVKKIKLQEEVKLESAAQKKKITVFAIGVLFFITALLFKEPFHIKLILYLIAYILVAYDIVIKAFKNLIYGKFLDENFLMAIASIGAFCVAQYPEAVAVMIFYKVGEFFQDRAVDNSRKSIKFMMDLKPEYANLIKDNEFIKVAPEKVKAGDLILVKPGEKIPLDCQVSRGISSIDTKAITGESVPRTVKEGDQVYSGSINLKSPLTLKVEKEYSQSTVAKILELVENASSKKSKTENFITKFAKIYTPVIVSLAALLAILPPILLSGETFSQWFYRAMIFLVISCPCALVISIPLGFFGGIGAASRKGILIKGSNYLEALNKVYAVVFDKTGTLTKGVFKVVEIKPENGYSKDDILKYAAHSEFYSDHPIATSIKSAYGESKLRESSVSDYTEKSGYGISCNVEGKSIICGNSKLMKENEISFTKADNPATVIYIAVNGKFAGYLLIADEIKDGAALAISKLKDAGISKTIMLSGDNKQIADKIGTDLGIDEVHAELLPDQKVNELEQIEKENPTSGNIVFVGDGMNDAPVITRSDIGVAMGGLGVDAAIESADVVIMNDEPAKIAESISIARRTRKIVVQNIVLAMGVKLIVLLLGAAGFATMWEAVFADVGVALIAILNSSRV